MSPLESVLRAAERLLDTTIITSRTATGGYTPAIRIACETAKGPVFVKAGVTPLTAEFIRREISVYARQRGDFMPTFVGADDQSEIPILIIEDLSERAWPPPWTTRLIDQVVEQIERMHGAPTDLEPFVEVLGLGESQWETIADDPTAFHSLGKVTPSWLDSALPRLIEAEKQCSCFGEALCHLDLRSDNMCIGPSGAVFVDWNMACRSNARLDLGFWLPSLQFEGGPPPESILPDAPDVAAKVAGFFAARAGLPLIEDAPFVRRVQREQLETALPWAVRALGLPPLI